MTSEHVINLLGGLALFIFGMTFMSDGLKKLAGDYMKTILEKLTEENQKEQKEVDELVSYRYGAEKFE